MEKIKGVDLAEIGHKKVIVGLVLSQGEDGLMHVIMMPNETLESAAGIQEVCFDEKDWEKLLHQMDTLQVEVTRGEHLPKVILRKSQRNIEQSVSWEVFRRDNFTCRYCGDDKSPMTVDHLILWEKGGPSIVDNLVCSCKKCNRTRGNMEYSEWLKTEYYNKVSKNLTDEVLIKNIHLEDDIKKIKPLVNKRKR